jgi:dCMP deaminase
MIAPHPLEDHHEPRPSWTSHFLNIARVVATRSTCPRANVGVLIVRDRRILTTGYNGSAKGVQHCTNAGCEMDGGHCQRAIHAEINAIAQGALHGVSLAGATCYSSHQPCRNCTKALIAAGVVEIVSQPRIQIRSRIGSASRRVLSCGLNPTKNGARARQPRTRTSRSMPRRRT